MSPQELLNGIIGGDLAARHFSGVSHQVAPGLVREIIGALDGLSRQPLGPFQRPLPTMMIPRRLLDDHSHHLCVSFAVQKLPQRRETEMVMIAEPYTIWMVDLAGSSSGFGSAELEGDTTAVWRTYNKRVFYRRPSACLGHAGKRRMRAHRRSLTKHYSTTAVVANTLYFVAPKY